MTTQQATSLAPRAGRPRGQYPKPRRDVPVKTSKPLPEYLEARDLSPEGERPTSRVRQGQGSKARVVPDNAELHAALTSALQFGNVGQVDRLTRALNSLLSCPILR